MRITPLLLLASGFLAATLGAQPYAYIANSGDGTISTIDTATAQVVCTMPVGGSPSGVAVSPDGTRIYVSIMGEDEKLLTVDVVNNRVLASVGVGFFPSTVVVTPDGSLIFVASGGANLGLLHIIDAVTSAVLGRLPLSGSSLAVHPDGHEVYASSAWTDELVVIDTQTLEIVEALPLVVRGVAVHPLGDVIYVAVGGDESTLTVLDAESKAILATSALDYLCRRMMISPDGGRLYQICTNEDDSSLLVVIETSTLEVVQTVPIGPSVRGIAATPDGSRIYLPNYRANTVSVIDTSSLEVVATIPVGPYPQAYGDFIGPATAEPPRYCDCFNTADTLCIDDQPGDRRFKVTLDFETELGGGYQGSAMAATLAGVGVTRGGVLSFFDPANPEVLVKVLDGCGYNGHFWVFYVANTTVGFELTVEDTVADITRTYSNDDLVAAVPVTDTTAFATCP